MPRNESLNLRRQTGPLDLSPTQDVPARRPAPFRPVSLLWQDAQIVRSTASALGKRNHVVELQESRVELFACIRLPSADHLPSYSRANVPRTARRCKRCNHNDRARQDQNSALIPSDQRGEQERTPARDCNSRNDADVVPKILTPPANTDGQQGQECGRNNRENRLAGQGVHANEVRVSQLHGSIVLVVACC